MLRAIQRLNNQSCVDDHLHAMIARNKQAVRAVTGMYLALPRSESPKSGPCSRFLPCNFTSPGLPTQVSRSALGRNGYRFVSMTSRVRTWRSQAVWCVASSGLGVCVAAGPPLPGGLLASWIATLRALQFSRPKRPFSGAIAVGMARLGGFDPEFWSKTERNNVDQGRFAI